MRLSKDADKFERVMKPVLDLFRPDKDQPTLLDMYPEFFAFSAGISPGKYKYIVNISVQAG